MELNQRNVPHKLHKNNRPILLLKQVSLRHMKITESSKEVELTIKEEASSTKRDTHISPFLTTKKPVVLTRTIKAHETAVKPGA